jgi:ribosomal protein L37AE/L43A
VAKKGGGREAMASVELRWRLGWSGLRWASRREQVCQFNSQCNIHNCPFFQEKKCSKLVTKAIKSKYWLCDRCNEKFATKK